MFDDVNLIVLLLYLVGHSKKPDVHVQSYLGWCLELLMWTVSLFHSVHTNTADTDMDVFARVLCSPLKMLHVPLYFLHKGCANTIFIFNCPSWEPKIRK